MKQIVGLFGWLGLVLVLAALALRFIRPEMESTRYGLTVAGLVVTGLYVLSQWRDIARSFQGRNVKYGSIAAGSVVIFLAILIGINWIGSRQNKRWDLTSEQQFSLSDQSKQVVAELQKPLHVIVFYDGGQSRENDYRDKLDQYAYMSTQISVECDFGSLGSCERHRFGVTNEKSDILFQVHFDRSLAPNAPGHLLINSDVEGKGRSVNLYAVRILPGQ